MSWVAVGVAAVTTTAGIIKSNKASSDAKKLRASRKPFKTTQEIPDILNATTNRAQQGYDPTTLDYLTNQIDRAAGGAYGTAKRLGGNANDLSAIFDQQLDSIFKVASGNAALQMENFSKYLGAKELLSKNLEAEWASEQGLIKDDLQAAQLQRQEAAAQISNGINTGIAGISAYKTNQLYEDRTDAINNFGGNNPVQPVTAPATNTDWRQLAGAGNTGANTPFIAPPVDLQSSVQSVSQMVTPTNINFGGGMIIGYDENGNPIRRR